MLAAALQLTVGSGGAPYIELPHDPPWFGAQSRDFVLSQPIMPDAHGVLHLGKAPGLGFEVNPDILSRT
jgi:L-alanine-DL-glutamate epimerase-like enolase superfamily enzyme